MLKPLFTAKKYVASVSKKKKKQYPRGSKTTKPLYQNIAH